MIYKFEIWIIWGKDSKGNFLYFWNYMLWDIYEIFMIFFYDEIYNLCIGINKKIKIDFILYLW